MIGWILVGLFAGAVLTKCLVAFWDNISSWLNNVAANAVERAFGYKARDKMIRATAKIDKIMDKVRNKATVYTKKDHLSTHYLKTDITAECSIYEIDSGVIEEIKKEGYLVQEFEYRK